LGLSGHGSVAIDKLDKAWRQAIIECMSDSADTASATLLQPEPFVPSDIPLQWVASIDSTNASLLAAPWPAEERFGQRASIAQCLVAEHQTAGRGRQRKVWHDAPGACLLMSLSIDRSQAAWPDCLSAFSIATALCVIRGLEASRTQLLASQSARAPLGGDLWLKWPNDVVRLNADGRLSKLVGILIETRQFGQQTRLVIGLGINLLPPGIPAGDGEALSADGLFSDLCGLGSLLDRPWRLALAKRLSADLLQAWTDFEAEGLAPSAKQLHALDVFQGRSLIFQHEGQSDWHKGIGRGIDEHGRLCIACEPPGLAKAGIERLSQGSVRLLQSQAELKS